MSQHVGTLRARLGLDSAQFQRGLNRSRGSAATFVAGMRRIFAPLAAAAGAALTVRGIKNTLGQVDAQAKLARSLGTTTQSMQVLARAGELAGVSMSGIEQGAKDLFRRLSQAASGGGPAADALKRLQISASDLLALPLDQRLAEVNDRITKFVPAAQRAAVAGALFGEEGAIALTRLDPSVIAQATSELQRFGFAISDVEAGQIEAANDAMSSLGLVFDGLKTRVSVALAPALQGLADGMAALLAKGGPLRAMLDRIGTVLGTVFGLFGDVATIVRAAATDLGSLAASIGLTGDRVSGLAEFLSGAISFIPNLVRGLARTIGFFADLVTHAGGFGEALALLGPVANEVWGRILDGLALIGQTVQAVGNSIAGAFTSAFATVVRKFAEMTQFLADGWNKLLGSMGVESNAQGIGSGLADRLESSASGFFGNSAALNQNVLQNLSRLTAPITALEDLKAKIAETGEVADTAITDAAEAATELGDAATGAGGSGAAAVEQIGKAAKDAKPEVNGMRDSFKQMFSSVLTGASTLKDALSQLLNKMVELAANNLFDSLFPTGRGGGSGGGFLSSLVGAISPGFATGTNSAPGGLALVGEQGRELVNLPRGSQVIPNGRTESLLRAGGRVEPVVVNVINNGSGQVEQRKRTGPNGQQIIDVAVSDSISNGRQDTVFSSRFGAQTQTVRR